jgi:hypothetical protein
MDERDLLRIVRNMLTSVVDLVDSNGEETKIPAVLRNVRDGTAGFCSLLDELVIDANLEEIAGDLEDLDERHKDEE